MIPDGVDGDCSIWWTRRDPVQKRDLDHVLIEDFHCQQSALPYGVPGGAPLLCFSLFSSFHGVPVLSTVFHFKLITGFLSACSLNHFSARVFVNHTFVAAHPVSLISCLYGLFSCCISVHFTGLIPFIGLFIVV